MPLMVVSESPNGAGCKSCGSPAWKDLWTCSEDACAGVKACGDGTIEEGRFC